MFIYKIISKFAKVKIHVIKTLSGFKPLSDSDKRALDRFGINEVFEIDVKKARNYEHHKKFFALLNLAFQNQEKYKNFKHFRALITMKSGHYEEIKTEKGIIYLPTSISFSNMDQIEFDKLYDDVCDIIINEVIPGITKEEIQDEILNFM